MGDHRANIKIEMEFHGVKDDCDMWVNYFPRDCCNMDQRVIDFFNNVHEKGMRKYEVIMEKSYARQNKDKIEKQEKAELKRLKEKYD